VKIHKTVNVDIEVEVDVDLEEIVAAISEDPNRQHTVLTGLNNFARFSKAIPDEIISGMHENTRGVIYAFLIAEAERFRKVMERATGETTRQMEAAPQGAIFIWCNGQLSYPIDLASKIGRSDLKIVSPIWLEGNSGYVGKRLTGVVLDHAANLTSRQWDGLNEARLRIKS